MNIKFTESFAFKKRKELMEYPNYKLIFWFIFVNQPF